MANTTIQLKKSGTPSAVPSDLANGELAINFADGRLFYKNTTGHIISFISGSNCYGTINANNTLVVAGIPGDILTLVPGTNITIVGDAITDRITISSNIAPAFDQANNAYNSSNTAQYTANLAFDKANTAAAGGGSYDGNRGPQSNTYLGDIFRVHSNTLTQNVTIYSGNNAICAGPIAMAPNVTLTIQTGARVVIS